MSGWDWADKNPWEAVIIAVVFFSCLESACGLLAEYLRSRK